MVTWYINKPWINITITTHTSHDQSWLFLDHVMSFLVHVTRNQLPHVTDREMKRQWIATQNQQPDDDDAAVALSHGRQNRLCKYWLIGLVSCDMPLELVSLIRHSVFSPYCVTMDPGGVEYAFYSRPVFRLMPLIPLGDTVTFTVDSRVFRLKRKYCPVGTTARVCSCFCLELTYTVGGRTFVTDILNETKHISLSLSDFLILLSSSPTLYRTPLLACF